MSMLTDGSSPGRPSIPPLVMVGAAAVVVVGLATAVWFMRRPPVSVVAPEPQVKGEPSASKPPIDPFQPVASISRPGWKLLRISLSASGKYVGTLALGAPPGKTGPRLTVWDVATGKEDYQTDLLNVTERWREDRAGRLRYNRSIRRVSRLLAAPANPLAALVALTDLAATNEVRAEESGSKSAIVRRYSEQGVREQFRVFDGPQHPQVLSAHTGLFVDQDPPNLDEQADDSPELFVGVGITSFQQMPITETLIYSSPNATPSQETVFSADGQWFVRCTGKVFEGLQRRDDKWDFSTLFSVEMPDQIRALTLAGDGQSAIVTCADGRLHWWHKQKPAILEVKSPSGQVTSVAFSADGKKVVLVGEDRVLHVRDLESDREIAQSDPASAPVTFLALSSDTRRVALATRDGSPLVWDIEKDKELKRLKGAQQVLALDLSADGQRLAVLDATSTVLVWALAP